MTTLVFGHKSPDTDSTGSPIIWAWYLNEVKGSTPEASSAGRAQHRGRLHADPLGPAQARDHRGIEAGQAW
jgi:manganese-dependent inorganic pyrophosphatase